MFTRIVLCVCISWLTVTSSASAQSKLPPPPENYDVQFRYRIRTDRDDRIRQFKVMTAALEKLGFKKNVLPDDDLEIFDPLAEIQAGTIPSGKAWQLLNVQNVKTVLLIPSGTKLPDNAKQPVQIRMLIAQDNHGAEQRLFHEQTVQQLQLLGFVEARGYDHARYSKVRGTIPSGNIVKLLKDLRTLPGGWFAAETGKDLLPTPFRNSLPIRLMEVLPDFPAEAVSEVPPLVTNKKYSSEVQAIMNDEAKKALPLTVELVFDSMSKDQLRAVRTELQLIDGVTLEGIIDNVANIQLKKASSLDFVAQLAYVRHIRLPRIAAETALPEQKVAAQDFLKSSKLDQLHLMGYQGERVKVAIIASDFPDRANLLKGVKYIDLTTEANTTLEPLAIEKDRVSTGTATALAFRKAAPKAELVLVRIDPAKFHQLMTIARTVMGEGGFSLAQFARSEEFHLNAVALGARRRILTDEYRAAFNDLSDDPKVTKRRNDAAAGFKVLMQDEAVYQATIERFLALRKDIVELKGTNIVVNTLVWESGFTHDGLHELSEFIEANFAVGGRKSAIKAMKGPQPPSWIQAASVARDSLWADAFLDHDGNGVMEFTSPFKPVAKDHWSRELNFLAYQPITGEPAKTLPAGSKVRVSVQWREPRSGESVFHPEPVIPLILRVLRQVDPNAEKHSTDDFVQLRQTTGDSIRLYYTEDAAVFEASVDVTIPSEGVYALMVELDPGPFGKTRETIQGMEIRPRIAVEMLDSAQSAKGRVVFATTPSRNAGVGIPGDSPAALTVGNGKTQTGMGPGVVLRVKPEAVTPADSPAVGVGSIAGLAACMYPLGIRANDLMKSLNLKPGNNVTLDDEWLRKLKPKAGRITER